MRDIYPAADHKQSEATGSVTNQPHDDIAPTITARQVSTASDAPNSGGSHASVTGASGQGSAPDQTVSKEESSSVAAATPDSGKANVASASAQEQMVESGVGKSPAQQPLQASHLISDRDSFSAPPPPGSMCQLPDGTTVDLSDVERRLEAAAPILARAVVYHLPGQTYFVSMLSLKTQAWQNVQSSGGAVAAGALPHHLLHEDVVAAISARGSSAMTTMEAKNDK